MGRFELLVVDSDDDAAAQRDLYDAVVDDDSLRPVQKNIVAATPAPGHMSGAVDILSVVLNPELITALSACITAWFATRTSRLKLKVRGAVGEATVEFKGRDVVTEEAVRRAFEIAEGNLREAPQ
jgi:hypothetical protein